MFGIVRGLLRFFLLAGAVLLAAGSYGYYRWAVSRLPEVEGGPSAWTVGLCRTTASLSGATLPYTFEAHRKALRAHNWFDGGAAGLVSARYEWAHGNLAWVRDAAFEERQEAAAAERKRLARRPVGDLIEELGSADAARREVAAKELWIRTGETHGYRYDAPEAERAAAIEAWRRWWARDENKLRVGARRAIDAGQKALDTLRRALGEPEHPPPGAPASGADAGGEEGGTARPPAGEERR